MIQILKFHETILIFYAEYKNILEHLLIIATFIGALLSYAINKMVIRYSC